MLCVCMSITHTMCFVLTLGGHGVEAGRKKSLHFISTNICSITHRHSVATQHRTNTPLHQVSNGITRNQRGTQEREKEREGEREIETESPSQPSPSMKRMFYSC